MVHFARIAYIARIVDSAREHDGAVRVVCFSIHIQKQKTLVATL
jgi:hypothetical protein